jgi:hypothetical protein
MGPKSNLQRIAGFHLPPMMLSEYAMPQLALIIRWFTELVELFFLISYFFVST